MDENYINIFCRFVAELMENGSFSLNDLWFMLNEFKPYCEKIKSRADLINFLNPYLGDYPELIKLKEQLENSNYKFI